MFDFLFFPGGRNVSQRCPSRLMPGKEAVRQALSLNINASHWALATVSFTMVEEIQTIEEINGVYHQRNLWVEGSRRAPTTTWEVTGNLDACRLASIAMGLVTGDVHGTAKERFTYDLLWAALRDNPATHTWMREHFPKWFKQVKQLLESTKGAA